MSASEAVPVMTEVKDTKVGTHMGQTKWFNDKLGFGFVTIIDGEDKGKDIFVHHSGVHPSNSNYKTLRKGEYISFNVVQGQNGLQAVDVRGIGGGPLMCDFVSTRKPGEVAQAGYVGMRAPPPPPPSGWQTVSHKKNVTKYQKRERAPAEAPAQE